MFKRLLYRFENANIDDNRTKTLIGVSKNDYLTDSNNKPNSKNIANPTEERRYLDERFKKCNEKHER